MVMDTNNNASKNNRENNPNFRAVIITALDLEFLAVKSFLPNTESFPLSDLICDKGVIELNKNIWEILIVESGEHNVSAALTTKSAISDSSFKPDVALFVGVSGKLKDLKIGDVAVSKTVKFYEAGKAGETFLPRIKEIQINQFMNQLSMSITRDEEKKWLNRIKNDLEIIPIAKVGTIASGSLLVASTKSPEYDKIKEYCSEALAVEMEGFGFLQAVDKMDALVIRGISDLIDDKSQSDAKGSQQLAAKHAAAFAFEVLAKYGEMKKKCETKCPSPVHFSFPSIKEHGLREQIKNFNDNISTDSTILDTVKNNNITTISDNKCSTSDCGFPSYEIGSLRYPVEFLMGHPFEGYKFNDIICKLVDSNQKIPDDIGKVKIQLIEEFRKNLPSNASFFNGSTVRIEDWGKIEDRKRCNAKMLLLLSRGEYFSSIFTNFSLDKKILLTEDGHSISIREKYANKPIPLKKSILGNLLGFTVNVVTKDNKVILTERSARVALYPELFNTAVSGTINPDLDCDENHIPNPFLSAKREIYEEIGLHVDVNDITFSALIIEYDHCRPELIGEVKIDKTLDEMKKIMRRSNLDHFEYERLIDNNIDFTPENLYPLLKNNKWIPQGAICIIFSLIKKWGEERVEMAFK
jgi:nucleoside phosphorylase